MLAVRAVAANEGFTATKEEALDYIREVMGEDADAFIERAAEPEIWVYEDLVLRKKAAEAVIRAKNNKLT